MDLQRNTAPTRLVAWCAAASLGLLFLKSNSQLSLALLSFRRAPTPVSTNIAGYLPLAAPLLALTFWQLFPRQSWPRLLAAGALCAVPLTLIQLVPALYGQWMATPVAVLTSCAPVFTLVGVLGATTLVWQAGLRAVGAALAGTALVAQLLGPVIITTIAGMTGLFFQATELVVIGLVLEIVALVGAVIAMLARQPAGPAPRPTWRLTLAAGMVSFAPALVFLIAYPNLTDVATVGGGRNSAALLDFYLYSGLLLLTAGVVAGAIAGTRALVGAAATGLALGGFGTLITPSAEVLVEMPVLAVVAAVASMLAGMTAALHRERGRIGIVGLSVVALGLLALAALFNSDQEFSSYETVIFVATPVLLIVGIVAAVTAFATVGDAHAATSETPAVLGVLASPFALGTIAVIGYFTANTPDDKAPIAGLLPPAGGALFIAAALFGLIAARSRSVATPHDDHEGGSAIHAGSGHSNLGS